ncbi:MAG: insulinase family protein [Lachnospiraceae bacterium]|nr:insulinase family protein [Butyrivibrio sp.]MCM1344726.1 insulinase family protein [Muribaculaceae bacterium]MCM1412015.1 insulinase family protein [Lachnospiraceae bacterium]
MRVEDLSAYEVIEKREIGDIKSTGYLVRHRKTGAKIALLENEDENKVFYIGFRTPPKDSTGVAHILEHSVLCGSREFPVKDPFVELVKGSLNTFLNAMTYPDKTVYPVASCHDKDFQNLMHVYLDAVFYPNIYENESIFRQEGWHYEMDEEGQLSINGVVYNEMKGAFSSPDDVLEREITNALYPHTIYGCESGGDPDVIPDLTYEQFLDFHRRYYHPSNSYIYLYGNMDMAEKLIFIDEHYLSAFEPLEIDSSIGEEPAFAEPGRKVKEYPISEGEDEEENTFLSWNLSVGNSLDKELYVAFQILDYALCSAPGAPLKQALVEAGVGKDVYSIYENGIRQPYFSVIAKDTSLEKEQQFLAIIRQVLGDLAEKGFDEKALLAGINYYEFKYREADFGSYPKGLMYGLQILDSWLYDDRKPFLHIEANDTFAFLKKQVGTGYFEKLVKEYLLDNPHGAVVILKPEAGLGERQEEALRTALAKKKAAMGEEELAKIRETFEALNAFQEREDSPEDLARIPLLTREDMKKEAAALINEERIISGMPLLYHKIDTNGIGYLRLIFKCQEIPEEYFPYIGLLKGCLGLLDTEHFAYGDLFNEMNLVTGGMAAVNNAYSRVEDPDRYTLTMEVKTKVLYENIGRAIDLIGEILLTSDFTDAKRLKEILAEGKSRMQAQMISSGHMVAAGRALSYGSMAGAVSEIISGVPFYRLTADLEQNFKTEKEQLIEKLQTLSKMIFRPENLTVDFVGDEQVIGKLEEPIAALKERLYTCPVRKEAYAPVVSRQNEGLMTSGQVQYVCRAGSFRRKGLPYQGALRVLKVIEGYEYLWMNVRVKGGAYGCMCSFGKTGECYFVSYRDPNLGKTLEIFEKAADAIAAFEADERTMTQYIIGAVSELDMPKNPAAKGLQSLSAYMMGITSGMLQKERDEILAATPETIRSLAEYIRAFMAEDNLCVVGNAQKIRAEENKFMKIENLF